MYVEFKCSGAFVHFNQHGTKTSLHKRNGLNYDILLYIYLGVATFSKFCFTENFASYAREDSRMDVDVHGNFPLEFLILKRFEMNGGNLAKSKIFSLKKMHT